MKLHFPIMLTWLRVVLVPFFVAIYCIPYHSTDSAKNILASIIFIIAASTDYFDGYLARKMKLETRFGAFLDPVADKALVVSSVIVLTYLHRTLLIFAVVIILREIAISALREWVQQLHQSISVLFIGKVKTFVQMIAILLLLIDYHTYFIGNIFMLLAVILTLVSMIYYLQQAKNSF